MSKRSRGKGPLASNEYSTKTSRVRTLELKTRTRNIQSRVKRERESKSADPGLYLKAGGMLRRIPRAAWICALIAFLNAASWSIIMPPFEVPDEPSHFAYTQQLVESHRLPTSGEGDFSPEEEIALHDVHQYQVHLGPEIHTISTASEQQLLQEDLAKHLSRHGGGGVGGAYADPPLYYMIQIIPYGLASAGTILDQLEAMRLLGALMGAITALFVFLFVRETLPGMRWAWTVGGLSVALAPLLGFMSGAVNPDSMLATVSAIIFYCLARGFRRGLTPRLAIVLGTMIAVGFLTKVNFVGLAPGAILGMILLGVQALRTVGRDVYRWLGLALAIALAPVWVYVLANLLSNHPALGIVSTSLKLEAINESILAKISYIWQLYLPRLPGMTNYFPGLSTIRQLWFDRYVGYYGWLDTIFPTWVDNLALLPAGLILALCARALIGTRATLRRRFAELAVYGSMVAGLLVLTGLTSYLDRGTEGLFAEPRYFIMLFPVVGVGLALAARGAGRRWGPAVGAAIVLLFLAHDLFSQLTVVARYYG